MANITASIPSAGIRGTGNLVSNADADSWRPGFMTLDVNGDVPLTALTNRMKKRVIRNRKFHWWDKLPAIVSANIAASGVYTNSALSSAYTSGGVAGTILYLKLTTTNGRAADVVAPQFIRTGEVILRDETDPSLDVVAEIVDVVVNGTSSYLQVKLLEADDNSSYTRYLAGATTVIQASTINPEGGEIPNGVGENPDEFWNYTQIFKESYFITGTMQETELRYGDQEKMDKMATFMRLGTGMEAAFLWGIPTENTGSNGQRKRTTGGLVDSIRTYAPDNIDSFYRSTATAYAGKTWIEGGRAFLNNKLKDLFRYGSSDKLVFAGMGAIAGLNDLAETYGSIQIQTGQKKYGLAVDTWTTPFGTLSLKSHPLFTQSGTYTNSMLAFEPDKLTYVVLGKRDVKFDDSEANSAGLDAKKAYFMAECGMEFHFPQTNTLLHGIGLDNVTA
jgi:hypothetical protein